ncbi:unnamed protein product [Caenorhabditis angaria]|uniref:Uncharacterized protein n=1 Tax=Caenorhabditis angaria TaxID=860376 RepID=A0A9P1J2U1_9PELO|nr:unnamed protein product [Caenorhabditis angaria]
MNIISSFFRLLLITLFALTMIEACAPGGGKSSGGGGGSSSDSSDSSASEDMVTVEASTVSVEVTVAG